MPTDSIPQNAIPQNQTVFVIDDDDAVRESIAALVDIRGMEVQTFARAEDFLESCPGDAPGCVVTDLRIEQGMSGIELQVALRERGWEIPVIVISAYANVANAVEAMHQGAITLLEKNCSSDELWTAIVEALATDSERRSDRQQTSALLSRFARLKADELAVLDRVISGTLNKVIAKELSISLRTVETRRANILQKVGVSSVPELVRLYVELEQLLGEPPVTWLRRQTQDETPYPA